MKTPARSPIWIRQRLFLQGRKVAYVYLFLYTRSPLYAAHSRFHRDYGSSFLPTTFQKAQSVSSSMAALDHQSTDPVFEQANLQTVVRLQSEPTIGRCLG